MAKQTEEERRLNSLLIQQTEQLAASNKDLQAFAHTVSHDLKAPLRAITNFSQILLDEHGTNLDAAGREHLSRIITAGKRMGNLIEDLITLSRITHRPLNRQPVNLADLARGVLADLGQGMQERKVEALIPENIPASADPNLARVALDNLIGNAWKYTGKAEHPRIEMGFEEKPGEPRTYFVRDNGAGFDMDHAEKLFMPFQRYHRTSEFEGTGIGLATVHRIIERHGGAIRAESRVGVGSAFYFTLEPAHKTPEIFRERQI
ncbi:hypothetical protein HYR69_06910 [Candidatus Sumerlaeota bacterium]|nr:hypothetical protein [Candidatus Sumerlaeota bacterium]